MKMRKATDNQAQPANVSCQIVNKKLFPDKREKQFSLV